MAQVANACVNHATMQSRYVNPYVNPYVIACGLRRGAGQAGGGHGAAAGAEEEAEEAPEMLLYEFVGDLAKYDLPDLVSADGEVVEAGWKAAELLRRALAGFRSMSAAERAEVENLLKRIFDPTGTVLAGRPFMYQWFHGAQLRTRLSFTREISAELFTKLCVSYRDETAGAGAGSDGGSDGGSDDGSNSHSLFVWCYSYERLPPQADVRVT
jgi:hypothetical protein